MRETDREQRTASPVTATPPPSWHSIQLPATEEAPTGVLWKFVREGAGCGGGVCVAYTTSQKAQTHTQILFVYQILELTKPAEGISRKQRAGRP